jgi:hypothetical protein
MKLLTNGETDINRDVISTDVSSSDSSISGEEGALVKFIEEGAQVAFMNSNQSIQADIETIQPEIVPYTEFNQDNLKILYNHSKSEYEEGIDVGYVVGYECGCNQNKTPEKKIPPGNITDPDFLNGFYDGFDLGYYKGTKYYYTVWIQINNNNIHYKRELINYVSNQSNNTDQTVDKSDPNYDPIQEKSFNQYYVYLKKKLMGKTHWFI